MDFLIPVLVLMNLMLGIALFVVKMAQMDQRHAARVRKEQKVKTYFRTGRWD